MKCRNLECQAEIYPNALFCGKCGTPVLSHCLICGKELPATGKVKCCPKCGTMISDMKAHQNEPDRTAETNNYSTPAMPVENVAPESDVGSSNVDPKVATGKKNSKGKIIALLSIIALVIIILIVSGVFRDQLEGQWSINGGYKSSFPTSLFLQSGGNAKYDGISATWSKRDGVIQISALGSTVDYNYALSGSVLVLTDSYGHQATYSKNGSISGYSKPQVTEQEALSYLNESHYSENGYNITGRVQQSDDQYLFTAERWDYYKYGNTLSEYTVLANYNNESLLWEWSLDSTHIIHVDLDVIGKWTYDDSVGSFGHGLQWIQINNIDLENMTITCSYDHRKWNHETGSGTFVLSDESSSDEIRYGFDANSKPGETPEQWFMFSLTRGVYIPWYGMGTYFQRETDYAE